MNLLKNGLDVRLVNGLQGDPAVFCFFQKTGDGVLFDLGALEKLTNKDIMRTRHVCVTHTHIDHFIGFDRLLRVNVPHRRPVELCGPSGFIENVCGKLAAYTWNLLDDAPLEFTVHELSSEGHVKSAVISSDEDFRPQYFERDLPPLGRDDIPYPLAPMAHLMTLTDGTRVEGVALDHGIPVIGYVCQSPCRYNLKPGALDTMNLRPGPWIRDLQQAMSQGDMAQKITVDERTFDASVLAAELFNKTVNRPFAYLTDFIFSAANLFRIQSAMMGTDVLVCETNFRDADVEKAAAKKHLTTKQAALIAASLEANHLINFHVSNIYANDAQASETEALEFFAVFKQLSRQEIEAEISQELMRVAPR